MRDKRVYGTVLFNGVRHEASGVINGTFAKTKGGWDTNTTCGKYLSLVVETDESFYVTCIRCLGQRLVEPVLRGKTADCAIIDDVQDFSPTQFMDLINEVGNIVVAGATRGRGGIR